MASKQAKSKLGVQIELNLESLQFSLIKIMRGAAKLNLIRWVLELGTRGSDCIFLLGKK
jgi:hypothetical protein